MLIVKEVLSKKEKNDFINFPLKLYHGCSYFVPPLYSDELKIFKKNYVYNEVATSIFFNAYLDGKMVGRISGIIQHSANAKWQQNRVRFTRFDSIDNQEVANALFGAVESWAKDQGIEEIVGPLGYSDLEREGLLIEGFDELATFEEQYNYDYYQRLIENYGFQKEVDWIEHKLMRPAFIDERLLRMSNLMMERYHLRLLKGKSTRWILKHYADQVFAIIDETYVNLYGTVPFTDGMKKMLISNFKLIVNSKFIDIVLDQNDRIVCFGIVFPSIAKALQKSNGKLTIPAIFRVLKALRKPKIIDMALVGVLPEYEHKGIASLMIAHNLQMFDMFQIEHFETNLCLETNHKILNMWKHFNALAHKVRRSYVKKID